MMGWADGYGWMGLGWIFMVLFWVLVILGIVALLRWLGTGSTGSREAPRKTPLDILQEPFTPSAHGR